MARKSSAAVVVEDSTETLVTAEAEGKTEKVKDKFTLARSAQRKLDKLDRNKEAFIASVVAKAEEKAALKFEKKRAKIMNSLTDEVRDLLSK
jgi:hypothetical protein